MKTSTLPLRKHPRLLDRPVSLVGLLVVLTLLLSGCGPGVPDPGEVNATEAATPTLSPPASDVTPTSPPTRTPTAVPPRALLILPSAEPTAPLAEVEATVSALSTSAGLALERRQDLPVSELGPGVRLVIALTEDLDLASLAEGAREIQFLAVGVPGAEPSSNVSVIGPEGFRPDQQAFLAGYLAAVLTEDWRVGTISRGDTPEGQAARQGFLSGALYFCGLCRPAHPPFEQYPAAEMVGAGDLEAARLAVDALAARGVRTVYLYPGVDSADLRSLLAQADMGVLGETPGDAPLDNWIAAVRAAPERAIEEIWPRLLAGEGGQQLPMPLAIEDVNPSHLSPGRLKLASDLIPELMSGAVDTGVDPQTGAGR